MGAQTALLALAAILVTLTTACGSTDGGDVDAQQPTQAPLQLVAEAIDPTPEPTPEPLLQSELVIEAEFPAVMAFAPDGRLFYNELKNGNVRVITPDGEPLADPFATVPLAEGYEWGLIGLAFDPDFGANGFVYVFYTAPVGDLAQPTILRYRDQGNVGVEPTVIVEFPVTPPDHEAYHVSGNIHFDAEGYLWVTLGDYAQQANAQDLSTPMGSILRLSRDGSPAPGNPFAGDPGADPRIYAYGLRNSWDFAFHPQTGAVYATENGLDNCDELNILLPGENYGWPVAYQASPLVCANNIHRNAIHHFQINDSTIPGDGAVSPTGIAFAPAAVYPSLGDTLLVCEFNTWRMMGYTLSGEAFDIVTPLGPPVANDCALGITVAPDGSVYYSNIKEIRRLLPR